MELFLHGPGEQTPRLVEIHDEMTVEAFVVAFGEVGEGIWVEDQDVELVEEVIVVEVVTEHDHVHHHRCRSIDVVVRYLEVPDIHKEFAPAATVGRVLRWALGPEGFNIPEAEHPEYGFLSCVDGKSVPDNVHVGSLASGHSCEACLSLVKKRNPQG